MTYYKTYSRETGISAETFTDLHEALMSLVTGDINYRLKVYKNALETEEMEVDSFDRRDRTVLKLADFNNGAFETQYTIGQMTEEEAEQIEMFWQMRRL